jgi:hypothetical protein
MTLVKFASGEEKQFDADAAVVSGLLFVLHKWNPKRRKLESGSCFPADQVAWARLPTGNIVLGTGRVESGLKSAS